MPETFRLDQQHLAALCDLGTCHRYRPGALLFREGDRSSHVIVLRHGVVKVYSTARSGYETVLAVRAAGEIVGEFAAFDQRPRSASVAAIEEVYGVLIGGEAFRGYLRREPDLALVMFTGLVHRLRESDRRRMEYGAYSVTARVARLLLELAESDRDTAASGAARGATASDTGSGTATGPAAAVVALSQRELAGIVGASREAVARSLRLLRAQGAIVTDRLRITVLQPATLRRLGDEAPHADPCPP